MHPEGKLTSWQAILKLCALSCLFFSSGLSAREVDINSAQQQVYDAELAFANTMTDRDFVKFQSFVSLQAVFLSGQNQSHGRRQVAASWKPFFQEKDAPFSWQPETVVVLESGDLALSTGPVFNPAGEIVATFTSTWRQEEPGVWRVIFDKGNKHCPEQKKSP